MKKLIALYKAPEDADAFFAHYRNVHLPLVHKIPGLVGTDVTRINRTLSGEKGNFLLVEMLFADETSFANAMKSPECAATGKDAATFAGKIVTIMTGETLDLS
jgi:uncharacterized protein (TIGR02118 family)